MDGQNSGRRVGRPPLSSLGREKSVRIASSLPSALYWKLCAIREARQLGESETVRMAVESWVGQQEEVSL